MTSEQKSLVPVSPNPAAPFARLEVILSVVSVLSGPDNHAADDAAAPDAAALLDRCQLALPDLASRITASDVRVAVLLTTRAKGLFGIRQSAFWARAARAISTRPSIHVSRRAAQTSIGVAAAVLVLLGVSSFWQGKRSSRWVSDVAPISAQASKLAQDASLLTMTAGSVNVSPAGAYTHAQAAMSDVQAANEIVSRLYVSNSDSGALDLAFRLHSDAQEVLTHDKPLLASMEYRLHHAHSELDLAREIQNIAQKWSSATLPASLPTELGSYWLADVASLTTALQSGDIAAIESTDQHLDALIRGSQDQTAVTQWLDTLPRSDHNAAAAVLSPLSAAIGSNDTAATKAILAQWNGMKANLPLDYQLLIPAGSGTHGVVRALSGSTAKPRDYLIVHAVDTAGAPITVSVFDTESQTLVPAQQFGVEVPADVFAAIRAQVASTPSNVRIGYKTAGSTVPAFSVAVLPGRITHW